MIYIGADHRGYGVKERIAGELEGWGYDFCDLSQKRDEEDDYSDIALELAEKVAKEKTKGILLCGSGAGVCVTANKVGGIRAGMAFEERQCRKMREDDDINILCLSADWVDEEKNVAMVRIFLETNFGSEKKQIRRIKKISKYEATKR
ncbi:RpiB/LacA/LacB family sugar-phosphate isomerase [Patescibacteria group bacterium]|nr:RpiB/LacA/LacB family sugar-phosphate isomerase [Patescibacteria group bacterium]